MTRDHRNTGRTTAIGSLTFCAVCALSALALVAGCGGETAAKPPVAANAATAATPAAPAQSAAVKPTINLSGDILAACKITLDNPDKAPKFDLDSASVSPEERDVLGKLATCLTTGPLKGRKVQLVGRADSRGEVNYNMALGAGRAKSVSSYLTNLGVEPTRLKETSRGELDATGTEDESMRRDRRVDINLAD